jgi:hypothetical protein
LPSPEGQVIKPSKGLAMGTLVWNGLLPWPIWSNPPT